MPSPSADSSPTAKLNSPARDEPTPAELAEDRLLMLRERGTFAAAILLTIVGTGIVLAASGGGPTTTRDPSMAALAVAVVFTGLSAVLFLSLARQALGFFTATASLILFLMSAVWSLAILILTLASMPR